MVPAATPPPPRPPAPWRPRYTIMSLMLVTLVCAVLASGGYYFLESMRHDNSPRAVFIIILLCTPILLMTLLSGLMSLLAWLNRRR